MIRLRSEPSEARGFSEFIDIVVGQQTFHQAAAGCRDVSHDAQCLAVCGGVRARLLQVNYSANWTSMQGTVRPTAPETIVMHQLVYAGCACSGLSHCAGTERLHQGQRQQRGWRLLPRLKIQLCRDHDDPLPEENDGGNTRLEGVQSAGELKSQGTSPFCGLD